MNTNTTNNVVYSDRLAWAFTLLATSFLFNIALSGYGIMNLSQQSFDPQTLSNMQPNILQTVVGCLSPLSFLIQIGAVILLLMDSRRIGQQQKKLGLIGFFVYLLSIILGIGSMPLAFMSSAQGSLQLLQTTSWIGTANSILSNLGILIMVYAIVPGWIRALLGLGILSYSGAGLAAAQMLTSSMTLGKYDMMGNTYYFPNIGIDKSTGVYPALLLVEFGGQFVFAFVFTWLAVTAWKTLGSELPETVS